MQGMYELGLAATYPIPIDYHTAAFGGSARVAWENGYLGIKITRYSKDSVAYACWCAGQEVKKRNNDMRKFIVLDVDGVMVLSASWKPVELLSDGFMKFNKRAIEGLNKIISETGAFIILSTSHKSKFTISEWEAIFKVRGINVSIDKLDDNISNLNRKDEILNWVNNRWKNEKFVIIDDDKSLNDLPGDIKRRCILISPLIGLNEDSAIDAISILKHF